MRLEYRNLMDSSSSEWGRKKLGKPHIDRKRLKLFDEEELVVKEKNLESFLPRDSRLGRWSEKKREQKLEKTRTDRIKKVVKKEKSESSEEEPSIEAGDVVQIRELLFTDYRDHLVKFNGDRVKADQLKGKVVIIYFVSLSRLQGRWFETTDLVDAYNELSDNGSGFEVVFVAVRDDCDPSKIEIDPWFQKGSADRFTDLFSIMPWTAIPFSDAASRKRLEKEFGLSNFSYLSTASFIIDPMGNVLHCHAWPLFRFFGAEGFPFTNEKIELVRFRYNEAAKQPSLKTLLASRKRKYLITNKGLHVPIWKLEGKVVALYLYEEGYTKDLTEKLKMVYKELKGRGENFEVVLVNLHYTWHASTISNVDSFQKTLSTMPWLALPFRDCNCRKVAQIFGYPFESGVLGHDPKLVIIGPNGNFIERFGANILMKYGIEAYPFTREKVVKLEAERVKKLNMYSLLELNAVLEGKYPTREVRVSQVAGKRILLFIEGPDFKTTEFVMMIKQSYYHSKGKGEEFEVIHICLKNNKASYNESVAGLPWLVYPFCEDDSYADKIISTVFTVCIEQECGLVAFERDGMLVTKALHTFFLNENKDYPFTRDLETEIFWELSSKMGWR